MNNDTYRINVRCHNCGKTYPIDIEKGITVFDYLFMKKCSNCGCHTLEKDLSKDHYWQEIL